MTSDPQVAPPSAIIYLIRHGETNENRNKIIQGHLDTLLNEDGRLQAGMVGRAMKEVPIDVLYSSDLKRAAEVRKLWSIDIDRDENPAYRSCGLIRLW